MSRRLFVAAFEHESDILGVAQAVREHGWKILDIYAPYAVHGLDKKMGLSPSRLPWICFLLGLLGAGVKMGFEYWASWIDWPVNVGGKPWDSLPAFVPLTFEIMVLFAGLSTVLALFIVSKLGPGKKPNLISPRVTNDQFALVFEHTGGNVDLAEVHGLLNQYHAVTIEQTVPADEVKKRIFAIGSLPLNAALTTALVVCITVILWSRPDVGQPNYEYLPDMAHSPAFKVYAANPNFPDGRTLRTPVAGTIPVGEMPLTYQATPEEALRAGIEMANPYLASDSAAVERGRTVFTNFCAPCHGVSGLGDGLIAARGYPPPPSLFAENAINMKDGQMFHLLSFGQGNMASYASQISREDRWKVIQYIRSLQAQEVQKAATLALDAAAATSGNASPALVAQ